MPRVLQLGAHTRARKNHVSSRMRGSASPHIAGPEQCKEVADEGLGRLEQPVLLGIFGCHFLFGRSVSEITAGCLHFLNLDDI
jgi:hypothetical protein